jgi:hypothetical protein
MEAGRGGDVHAPWRTRNRVLEKLTVAQVVNKLSTFMQPRGSLPCSKQPAVGLYAEPLESNPHFVSQV